MAAQQFYTYLIFFINTQRKSEKKNEINMYRKPQYNAFTIYPNSKLNMNWGRIKKNVVHLYKFNSFNNKMLHFITFYRA